MSNYYFLASALPPLALGERPEIGAEELRNLLEENLTAADKERLYLVRLYYDLENIRALWRGEELDRHGNLDENELEDALLVREGLPSYVYDFIDRYEGKEERLRRFPALFAAFFREARRGSWGFLERYFAFEREWRLVFTGFRAKQLDRDLSAELQDEDPEDELVAQLLAQKDAPSYEPPESYSSLKPLFEEKGRDPTALYQGLCRYRFEWVEKELGVEMVSFERVVGYLIQYIIVTRALELNAERGAKVVEAIAKG